MNTSSDAAEQIVRISLEGFEVTARITGSGAKDVAALLVAIMNDNRKIAGKTNLTKMMKTGKNLMVFTIKKDNFKKFTEEAKRYGILYSSVDRLSDSSGDGVIDIMVREEDASKINRIVERFKFIDYNMTNIRSNITELPENKGLDEEKNEKINPHLARTEKSPQSKPSSEMQKTSNKGTKLTDKPSVAEKLVQANDEIRLKKSFSKKSEVKKRTPKSKNNREGISK